MVEVKKQPIEVGDRFPEVQVQTFDVVKDEPKGYSSPKSVNTKDIFSGKNVAVFAVTGAFTPVCSEKQLPSFVENFDNLKQKGVDEVVCISVNDAYTLAEWAKQLQVLDKFRFIADGNAVLARSCGLLEDLTEQQLGYRFKRCAMIVKDGQVKYIGVEPTGEKESNAKAVLENLKE